MYVERTAIAEHYEARWGTPTRTWKIEHQLGLEGEIHAWPEERTRLGVTIYATIGASAFVPETGHAVEFLAGISPDCPGLRHGLPLLVGAVAFDRVEVSHGVTFTFPGPLWPGTSMTGFICLQQKKTIDPLPLAEVHVEFYQAVPIFANELDLKRREGWPALMSYWRDNQVQFWDANRQAMDHS